MTELHLRQPSAPDARDAVRTLRPSQIREVANAGLGIENVLPFWFGESDRVTPQFIRDAAHAALDDGATFYTHNLGIAPLREALAGYVSALHGATSAGHVAVTSAGVNALMLAAQLVVGAGDRVVAVTPLWPNLVEIPKILGAHVDTVALDYGARGWTLDLERRMAEHNGGAKGARSTRGRVWALLYAEKHRTRRRAMAREYKLKHDRAFRAALRHLL